MKIRKNFSQEEIPLLYEIEKTCFASLFRWSKSEFTHELNKNDVWVADDDKGQIIGFLISKIERNQGYILTLEVKPEQRGQGVGAALVRRCEQAYYERGYKTIRLEVYTNNPAQMMYFKQGYRVHGFKKDYYALGHSAVSMSKNL